MGKPRKSPPPEAGLQAWMCGAQLRNKPGRFCKVRKMKGRNRCRIHGGTTPVGIQAQSFTHGRYSKYMPTGFLARYEASLADPEILSLKSEIAISQARVAELLQNLEVGTGLQAWQELKAQAAEVKKHIDEKDPKAILATFAKMQEIIEKGVGYERSWQQLNNALESTARLSQREWRREVDLELVLTAHQATVLYASIHEALVRHVQDKTVLSAICSELVSAFERGAGGALTVQSSRPAGL